jgi:membrane-associated protease RseP (regulator of RpoE activity)
MSAFRFAGTLGLVALFVFTASAAERKAQPTQTPTGATFGVYFKPKSLAGALITAVVPNGPADIAGFQPGDRILRIDDVAITNHEDVVRLMSRHAPGDKIEVHFNRRGDAAMLPARLGDGGVFPSAFITPISARFRPIQTIPDVLRGLAPADINDQHGFGG